MTLAQSGEWLRALAYVFGSNLVGLLGASMTRLLPF